MERFPQLLFVLTAREDSHLVASAFCFLDQRHPQRHPPTATPACLLTLKPALPAVVFPALLQSSLAGANSVAIHSDKNRTSDVVRDEPKVGVMHDAGCIS